MRHAEVTPAQVVPSDRSILAPEVLTRAADVIRCLGHPLRLRLLEALEVGERTVSELQMHARAGQAVVSQQLAALKARRIVAARREGVRVYYRIIEPKVHSILNCIRACDLDP